MQLKLLWDLQELDLAIIAVKKRIEEAPWFSGIGEVKARIIELKEEFSEIEELLRKNQKKLKQFEMQTQKIVDDRKELSDNLYGGKISNVKELEQMQRKMDLLAVEKQKTEDEILVLMEAVEEGEAALSSLEKDLKKNEEDLQDKEKQLLLNLEEYENELSRLANESETLVRKIEEKYMNKYRLLAKKNQGRALARVVDGICSGCRVFISSGLSGHLYNPDAMVYCENCGRLLVKIDEIDDPQ